MSSTRVAVLTALISASLTTCCEAQFVRWGGFGGVRVRAPFVAVDVSPYGGTWVRAPFTNVYSFGPAFSYGPALPYRPVFPYGPAFPYGPFPPVPPVVVVPAVPAYPLPTYRVPVVPEVTYQEPSIPAEGYQVTRPSLDGHVAEDLWRAATQLQASLSRRHDGDVWINYLNPGRIIDSVDRGEPPSSLRDLIANYDGVVANASLRPIYTAPGFDATRELLRVYVDLPRAEPKTPAQAPAQAPAPAPPAAQPPQAQETDNGSDTDQQEELPAPTPAPATPEEDQKQPTPPPPDPIPPKVSKLEPTDI